MNNSTFVAGSRDDTSSIRITQNASMIEEEKKGSKEPMLYRTQKQLERQQLSQRDYDDLESDYEDTEIDENELHDQVSEAKHTANKEQTLKKLGRIMEDEQDEVVDVKW